MKLGYAKAKAYKCNHPDCPRPGNYQGFKRHIKRRIRIADERAATGDTNY